MFSVFLVDDDLFVRKGLLQLIDWEHYGYEVCGQADNGEDALEGIIEQQPDLVVTDIRMPVIDGLELIRLLKEQSVVPPSFIIISGYSDFSYAQQAMRYGVHDFILKPIDKAEFEQTLRKLGDKLTKEEREAQQKRKMKAISIFEDVIKGRGGEEIMELKTMLSLSNSSRLTYVLLEINAPLIDKSTLKEQVRELICVYTNDDRIMVREHGIGRYGILLTERHYKEKGLLDFLYTLQHKYKEDLDKEITLIAGKTVPSLDELRASYKSVRVAEQYKYMDHENPPIVYETVYQQPTHYVELEQSYYHALMENIEEYNITKINQNVSEIFRQFSYKHFARDAVKTSINRFVHELIKTIKQFDGDETRLPSLNEMLQWGNEPYSIQQIKHLFSTFVHECSELIHKLHRESNKGNIHKIKKYIEAHYREQLTLKYISQKFFMNPVYIGQLFKKTYGIYFNDYVLQVRIKEAKRNLRQTDLRVYEVADLVGFLNPDYFVTQFEKITGMTPTQYRKKVQGKYHDIGDKNEIISLK